MTICQATSADAGVLAHLEAACFVEPWSARALGNALADDKYVVLLAQDAAGKHCGYALGWNVGDEAEVARVGVQPTYRGNGWGEKLTSALLESFAARGVRTVFLEVRASNEVAQRMYARCGFRVVGQRPEYYDDNETAVVMLFEVSAPQTQATGC
jgi:ribosomal-protein-alanine N-acetyltransferase